MNAAWLRTRSHGSLCHPRPHSLRRDGTAPHLRDCALWLEGSVRAVLLHRNSGGQRKPLTLHEHAQARACWRTTSESTQREHERVWI